VKIRVMARFVALAVVCLTLLTCGDSPTATAHQGWLQVRLTSTNTNDGGVLFTVGGGAIDSVRSSYQQFLSRREKTTLYRVVVGGSIANDVIAEVWVPDTRKASQYSATVLEAVVRGTYAQKEIAGMTLTVTGGQ